MKDFSNSLSINDREMSTYKFQKNSFNPSAFTTELSRYSEWELFIMCRCSPHISPGNFWVKSAKGLTQTG